MTLGFQDVGVGVAPGPNQPDPDVVTPAPTTPVPAAVASSPVPQASRRPANLADTGASAGELSALALLLLLAGGALMVGARRKPA